MVCWAQPHFWGELCCYENSLGEGNDIQSTVSSHLYKERMDLWTDGLKGLVKFNSGTLSPSHGSSILMCCLPVEHQETCVCPRGWTEAGAGVGVGLLTPMLRPSASLPVAHPLHLLPQWWSETYHRCFNWPLKDPRGLWEASHDLEAVRHLSTSWASSALMLSGWQFPRPGGPLISYAYSPLRLPFSLQTF